MPTDYLGQDISVGDEVLFSTKDRRGFLRGTITHLTPKMVHLEYTKPVYGDHVLTIKQYHDQVVRLPEGK